MMNPARRDDDDRDVLREVARAVLQLHRAKIHYVPGAGDDPGVLIRTTPSVWGAFESASMRLSRWILAVGAELDGPETAIDASLPAEEG